MNTIWRRVFYPTLAILIMGVVAFLGFGIWLPASFSKQPMLVGIASVSRGVAPIIFAAFLAWALYDCIPRLWTVKRWLDGKGHCCERCGGPTVEAWNRYKPRELCLQCGFKRNV